MRQRPTNSPRLPELIQGGMGVGVSSWRLARAVAMAGQRLGANVLGVVSGTGLPVILVDRLQAGDKDVARALNAFDPEAASEIMDQYAVRDPSKARGRRKLPPKPEVLVNGSKATKSKMTKLAVASAFVEVWLAKEGHSGPIGINVLEKVQLMHLPVLLGAMMAGVDYVLVGAGIPHQVPAVLASFARNEPASYRMDVEGSSEKVTLKLDPREFVPAGKCLKRPKFLLIASHHALAMRLAATVEVDGFVMEGPSAGGHNAPARGKTLADDGQPIYGERDRPDLEKLAEIGKPFWLAGSYGSPGRLAEAKCLGATGVQGIGVRAVQRIGAARRHQARVEAANRYRLARREDERDRIALGLPFQVVQLEGSLSELSVYENRQRICNIGHLTQAYQKDESEGGGVGFRCPRKQSTPM
ncbi:MAG: nitronate monooxygenase [Dehalococcoidia bacterium]|uniref:nitronate monooxygenase n=1 Tax=Candidatus Amarobacter glycogenicus TaxID=3140699 RepID=UPI00313631E1|nr:nitronate monooxygenase [Dehalococcoidia bacterium]